MAVIITPEDKVEEYFLAKELNQSLLKSLADGLEAFRKKEEEQDDSDDEDKSEKEHFIIGKGVDLMLTGENGAFFRKFYVSELDKKPSDAEMQIIQFVFDYLVGEDQPFQELKDYPGLILDACDYVNWQNRWKPETKITNIVNVGHLYFEDLKKAFGKQVISKTQYETICSIVMILKSHPRTAHFFDRETQEREGRLEFYYQLVVKFNVKGVECKAMLDLVIVEIGDDNLIKRVYPYDVKTLAGSTSKFIYSVHRRRYDFQGSWYTEALSQHFGVQKHQIENFQFIVESTTQPGEPLIYQMSDELLHIGQYGRPKLTLMNTNILNEFEKDKVAWGDIVVAREIKGWEQLIDEYLWYEENGWDHDRVIAGSNGVLKIDWNGIIPNEDADEEHRDFADLYK